jgi:hypothetical protein
VTTDVDASRQSAQSPAVGVVPTAVGKVAVGIGVVLLLVAGYLIAILRLKSRKRNRRRIDDESDRRTTGAFRSGLDTVIDLGGRVRPNKTDSELVSVGAATIDGDPEGLDRMAVFATQAVYDLDPPGDETSAEAWDELNRFERVVKERVGTWRWLKAKFSLRSLRRGLSD